MTDIYFAIAGCGAIAPTHARAIASLPDAKAAACYDIDNDKAGRFGEIYGIPSRDWVDILSDPSIHAVTICTPSGLHAALGVEALNAGKHVIVEKPIDITLNATDSLLEAQKKSGKTLACISQHRFDPVTQYLKPLLQSGELGKIVQVEMRVPWYREQSYYDSGDWRGTYALDGGGCLMNQGVHTVDLMLYLAGKVTAVYAQTRTAIHERIEVEDTFCATTVFENGAIGTMLASTSTYPGFPAFLAIYCEKGSAIIEGDALKLLSAAGRETVLGTTPGTHAVAVATGGTRSVVPVVENISPQEITSNDIQAIGAPEEWGISHARQLADFVRCCKTGDTPLVDGYEARNAVELILAAYQSAKSGAPVTLPL